MLLEIVKLVCLCIYEHLIAVRTDHRLGRCHDIAHQSARRIIQNILVRLVFISDADAFVKGS